MGVEPEATNGVQRMRAELGVRGSVVSLQASGLGLDLATTRAAPLVGRLLSAHGAAREVRRAASRRSRRWFGRLAQVTEDAGDAVRGGYQGNQPQSSRSGRTSAIC